MERKNYAEVLIDGKIYTLGGAEEQEYMQRVAERGLSGGDDLPESGRRLF